MLLLCFDLLFVYAAGLDCLFADCFALIVGLFVCGDFSLLVIDAFCFDCG